MKFEKSYFKMELKPISELKCFLHSPGDKLPLSFPRTPGVYILTDKEDKVLYIGKAVSLGGRVTTHTSFGCVTTSWVDKNLIGKIYVIECEEEERSVIEMAYQFFYESKYNNKGYTTQVKKDAGRTKVQVKHEQKKEDPPKGMV